MSLHHGDTTPSPASFPSPAFPASHHSLPGVGWSPYELTPSCALTQRPPRARSQNIQGKQQCRPQWWQQRLGMSSLLLSCPLSYVTVISVPHPQLELEVQYGGWLQWTEKWLLASCVHGGVFPPETRGTPACSTGSMGLSHHSAQLSSVC